MCARLAFHQDHMIGLLLPFVVTDHNLNKLLLTLASSLPALVPLSSLATGVS